MVVAGATALFGRWNAAEDTCPVGRDGSDMRKALDMAPVSLTADGIVALNTPMCILFWAASGSMQYLFVGWASSLPGRAVLVDVIGRQDKRNLVGGSILD